MALRIKDLRKQKGWTQTDLAERANISRSQLAMIETGARSPNTRRLAAIAAALSVNPTDLFEQADDSHLIALIRDLPPEDREALVRMAEALAAQRRNSSEPSE